MIPDDEDECADRANRSSHQRETGDMAHATAPPNRGPTEPGAPRATVLPAEQPRPPLKRGAKPAVRQNIARRGREPTNYPIRAVFRCGCQSFGSVGYSTVKRIRGPNLLSIVCTNAHSREGPSAEINRSRPQCRGDTRAGDIKKQVFTCGIQAFGRGVDTAR